MAGEPTLWELITAVFMPGAAGAFAWVLKRQDKADDTNEAHHNELWDAINEQRASLSGHKEIIARDYITKSDFNRLEAKIDRLGDILQGRRA